MPALLLAVSLGVSACAPRPAAHDAATGVRGTVLMGPACPVERSDSPCPDRPVAASVVVTDATGARLAHARTDANGVFAIALAPGTYTVTATPAGWPRSASADVTVRQGRYVPVRLVVDSGIR